MRVIYFTSIGFRNWFIIVFVLSYTCSLYLMCGFCIIYAGSASPMLSYQHVSDGNRLVKDLTNLDLKSSETGMYVLIPCICFCSLGCIVFVFVQRV